ncbi:hypothetical protein B0H17DRAFT_1095650 [Mycena rosella]|uniref:Uncharacterized protein n=1 Tax=Mycena rosella TaxID=1033263 RepID=A0AAD7CRX7_MYCRO|nr:hypothetical protein B0H17DRAFT_1095650 [Mycena rosella]
MNTHPSAIVSAPTSGADFSPHLLLGTIPSGSSGSGNDLASGSWLSRTGGGISQTSRRYAVTLQPQCYHGRNNRHYYYWRPWQQSNSTSSSQLVSVVIGGSFGCDRYILCRREKLFIYPLLLYF